MEKIIQVLRTLLYNLRVLPHAVGYRIETIAQGALGKPRPAVQSRLIFVLSFPRSGTTALGSLLQQPEAKMQYHGEFFAFNHWSHAVSTISKSYPLFSLRFLISFAQQKKNWAYVGSATRYFSSPTRNGNRCEL